MLAALDTGSSTTQRAANLFQQIADLKRLDQHIHAFAQEHLAVDRGFRIAGDEQDRQAFALIRGRPTSVSSRLIDGSFCIRSSALSMSPTCVQR
ncbi:hypothetical protein D3C76_1484440 [compost metagenome]